MNKQRAAKIIEMAFLNADGHILPHEQFHYEAQDLTLALRMAMIALHQNENQHVYIFMNDEDGNIVTDLWTTSVPDVDEKVIIYDNDEFHHYKVCGRIYGANAQEKVAVWNIYVEPIKKPKKE